MNNRQRILSILRGSPPDRIPWIPRLEIWYSAAKNSHTLPEKWAGMGLRDIEKDLGLGTPARDGRIFTIKHEGVEIITRQENHKTITFYQTPIGTLRKVNIQKEERVEKGLPSVVVEHLLKGPDDYKIWEWIVQNTHYTPTYEEFLDYDEDIGPDGLPMVPISTSPFYHFLEVLVGYEQAFYHLADYPDEVDHLLAVMETVQKQREWPIVSQSPAQLILTDAHISSQFTPPGIFKKYILPFHQELNDLLHANGKWTAMHADADTSQILDLIEDTGWDMLECFITAPMVPMTLERARKSWGNRIIIWGGIPSALLSPSTSEGVFQNYCSNIFKTVAPGDAFILGVADNVMPDSLIERVSWVCELVEERGWYPVGDHR